MAELRVVISGTGRLGRLIAEALAAELDMTPVAFVRGRRGDEHLARPATPVVQSPTMDELRVVISGAGKMGRQIAAAVAAESDMTSAAFLDGLATTGRIDHLPVYSDIATCLAEKEPHVVIDFTNAAWTPDLAAAALERGVRLVIGTSGLSPDFMTWLDGEAKARSTGVVVAANFAIGAVLMMYFAKQAARFFDNAEIIELHHDQKVDAPSGTAVATAELMRLVRETAFTHPKTERETLPGARGAESGGIAIHSVRLPGLVAHQEVLFGGLGQTLTIRHDSIGRESFMPGVVMATREVMNLDHLVVGLDRLFGLE